MQVFFDRQRLEREPILGAVGVLQFEVIQHRLKPEYNVEVRFEPPASSSTPAGSERGASTPTEFERQTGATCLLDVEQRPLVLFENDFRLQRALANHPELEFIAAVQPARRAAA